MTRVVGTEGLPQGADCKSDNSFLQKYLKIPLLDKFGSETSKCFVSNESRYRGVFKDADSEFKNCFLFIPPFILLVNLFLLLVKDKNKAFLSFHF